ncbi:SabA family sialic acid-binding adhesin, partial [Helicobacter pylori]|uniref:SabA family sialic acid-binding adhesin n=1 Tax=Helicobacter pylori TaxID=210 RepID=UPI0036F275B6
MKKTLLLSLSLASSLLNAEDNGFFISAGYQIGEAAQMVKNTGELKKLSDTYENLSNLLNNFNNLNQAVTNASSPSEINAAIDNLKANTQGLTGEKTNSPAYQAVYLALNAAVGLWNVIAYNVQCGPGNSGQQSVTFDGQPGHNSSSINCNLTGYNNGVSGPLSIDNFKTLNNAYQVLQQALKQGVPTLNDTTQKIEVKVTTQTNGQTSKETTTTTTNDAQTLLQEASKMISVLTTNCPWVNHKQGQNGGAPWGLNTAGNVCQVFATEFSAVTSMIKNAQEIVTQAQSLNTNQQSNQNAPQDFNPYTAADSAFAQNMLNHAQAQAKMLELAAQMKKDLNTIPSQFITNYLAACRSDGTTPSEGVTSNTWGAGCAYVEETITALNNSLAHFGTQAEQIKQSELLARTILDFRGSLSTLNNTYNSITTTASNTPNSPFLKNLISQSTNP